MFKFIMPSNSNYIDELYLIFKDFETNISRKYSSNKNI